MSTTIAQGGSNFINLGRVGPFHPVPSWTRPTRIFPWTLPDGQWQAELQLTAQGYPALHLTASFNVSTASAVQGIKWLTLAAT